MLKITTHNNSNGIVLKLEGRVVGPWAAELGAAWNQLASALGKQPLTVDLRDITFVDEDGMRILRLIYRDSRNTFQTASPLTASFAEMATQLSANEIQKGK